MKKYTTLFPFTVLSLSSQGQRSRQSLLFQWVSVSWVNKSPAVARGSRPYCMRPKASKCERSFFTYFRNFRYNVNFRHHPQILALQIAAKPLQIATLILLTVYRNLPTPHPTVTSLTSYDVPFSHNAYVTDDRLTDRRTTERTISATISTVG